MVFYNTFLFYLILKNYKKIINFFFNNFFSRNICKKKKNFFFLFRGKETEKKKNVSILNQPNFSKYKGENPINPK